VDEMAEALEGAYDYVEEAINRRIREYGEDFRKEQLEYMRRVKADCDKAATSYQAMKGENGHVDQIKD
jgi:hypothetical protein